MESNNKNKKQTDERRGDVEEKMSESDVSQSAVGAGSGRNRLWRKARQNPRLREATLSSDDEAAPKPAPGKIRTRRKEFMLHSDSGNEVQADPSVTRQLAQNMVSCGDDDNRPAVALKEQVLKDIGVVLNVATKSKHLKGTFQRALNEAATSIKVAVEALHMRSSTNENKKLEDDNSRLRTEVAELRQEISQLRKDLEEIKGSQCQRVPEASEQRVVMSEELTQAIMMQVGSALNERLEALEKRIPPPPPAAIRSYSEVVAIAGQSKGQENLRVEAASGTETGGSKKRGTRAKKSVTKVADNCSPLVAPAPKDKENEWVTVTKRGKKMVPSGKGKDAKCPQSKSAKPKPNKKASVKLRPPRSAAVVITLQPEAEKRGVTFASVLAKARAGIDLPSLNINGLKFRTAATGARILEVPGALSGDKADNLAQKIRETLDEGDAIVSRPVKCAEMRITGLDDSATTEDLALAIARDGGCHKEAVKVGIIRPTPRGTGSVWVRAPVAAAKKIGTNGRVLVGWVSAGVELLQPRVMRCYRCHETGHVRAKCTAEADRSNDCYRCGNPGHKATACTDTPSCLLCAAANRPARHRMGSKKCSPPKSKRKGAKVATVSDTPAQPSSAEV